MLTLKENEIQHIIKALIHCDGDLLKTSKLLDINVRTLYNRRRKFPELEKYVATKAENDKELKDYKLDQFTG